MKFEEIIGLNEVKQRLINTVKDGRISHAQLFLGKEGSGNLPLAIAYAQYISCQHKSESDSCGTCPSCLKYEKLVHPDLHFVFPVATNSEVKKDPVSAKFLPAWREMIIDDPYFSLQQWQEKLETGNKQLLIPKDESTEIIKTLSLKTYESEYKVMIIWFPERFNATSANKLLKIIEEPPQKTLFILVAHDKEQIIQTILSRTQLVKVGRVEEEALIQRLVQTHGMSEDNARKLAFKSDGNYMNAKSLLELSEAEEQDHEYFVNWMRYCFKADVIGLIEWSEEISRIGRERQKHFLNYGLHVFRESLMMNYGSPSLQRINNLESGFIGNFSKFIHGANCIALIELFNDASYHIERNANPKVVFLDMSFKIVKLLKVKASVTTT